MAGADNWFHVTIISRISSGSLINSMSVMALLACGTLPPRATGSAPRSCPATSTRAGPSAHLTQSWPLTR